MIRRPRKLIIITGTLLCVLIAAAFVASGVAVNSDNIRGRAWRARPRGAD